MSTWKQKLLDTYDDYTPPLDRNTQFALLWAYRRALSAIILLEGEKKRLEALNAEQVKMIQDFILYHPTYKIRVVEDEWKSLNKKTPSV